MKKDCLKKAFSLAEALITLLIVCIIAIVSAPVITKKTRENHDKILWKSVAGRKEYIHPTKNRDIMLGNKKGETGIIVRGELVFKNTKGEIIGWIKEDGTSSFCNSCETAPAFEITQEQIDRLVKQVSDSVKRQNLVKDAPAKTPVIVSPSASQTQEQQNSLNIDIETLLKELSTN